MAPQENTPTLAQKLGLEPASLAALIRLGDTFYDQGALAAARTVFEALVLFNPKLVYPQARLGAICQHEQKQEEALAWYDQALALSPNHPSLLVNRGEVRLNLGRLEEAAADFREAAGRDAAARQPAANRARLLAAITREALALAREQGVEAVLEAHRRLDARLQP